MTHSGLWISSKSPDAPLYIVGMKTTENWNSSGERDMNGGTELTLSATDQEALAGEH